MGRAARMPQTVQAGKALEVLAKAGDTGWNRTSADVGPDGQRRPVARTCERNGC